MISTSRHSSAVNYYEQGHKLMAARSYRAAVQAFKLAEMRGQSVRKSLEGMRTCYLHLDLPQMADVVAERLRLMN